MSLDPPRPAPPPVPAASWNSPAAQCRSCTACPELVATRSSVVVGSAPAGARLALVGEAPGAAEDAAGRPFVGRAGVLLDVLLGEAGLDRAGIAVLNTLKCRPPGNRAPARGELAACRGFLTAQLALVAPTLVVALGLTAARWFLGARTTLSAVRGRPLAAAGHQVLVTYHPSAALRFGPAGAPRALLAEDLRAAAALLAGRTVTQPPAPPPTPAPAPAVRPARPGDAPAVAALTRAAFAAQAALYPPPRCLTESVDTVAADLHTFGGLVAVLDAAPVAALRFAGDPPLRWIRRVAVHPDHQRRGLASRLLCAAAGAAAAEGVTSLRARVRGEVAANLRFYRGHGFVDVAAAAAWTELALALPRTVTTPERMRELGARLARLLEAGDLVLLTGPLGAGKTVFAQGIATGLGVTGPVTSPTFVISRRHRGPRLDLLHADAYRLGDRAELDDLDLDSELDRTVAVLEWGAGLAEGLGQRRWLVAIHRSDPPATPDAAPAAAPSLDIRRVTLRADGREAAERQDRLDREV